MVQTKTLFWHIHCFQKLHTIVHFKSPASPCYQVKLARILGNEKIENAFRK